jgi:hypothetical protein
VVSQSTSGDVGDDINMILSGTIFLSFDLIPVCGATVQAFDPYGSFCVAECYICWHFI